MKNMNRFKAVIVLSGSILSAQSLMADPNEARVFLQARIRSEALARVPEVAALAAQNIGAGHDAVQEQINDKIVLRRKVSLNAIGEAKFMLRDAVENLKEFGLAPNGKDQARLDRYVHLAAAHLAVGLYLRQNNIFDFALHVGVDYKNDV